MHVCKVFVIMPSCYFDKSTDLCIVDGDTNKFTNIMAALSENVHSDISAQRRLRLACALTKSDQNLHWAYFG